MNNFSPHNNKPFRPVAKFVFTRSEINIELSFAGETLQRLVKRYGIPTDISEKIILSIKDTVLRLFETVEALPTERRIFVTIHISANAKAGSGSNHDWGFFQIERMNASIIPEEGGIRLIELYLYLDR